MEKLNENRLDGIFSLSHQQGIMSLLTELNKLNNLGTKIDLPDEVDNIVLNHLNEMYNDVMAFINKKEKEMSDEMQKESEGDNELAELRQALGKFK